MRRKILLNTLLTVILSGGTSALAIAASGSDGSTKMITISAQPLESALTQFSKQTGITFGVESRLLAGKQAAAISGDYSTPQALELLLKGSGLYAELSVDGRSYILRPLATSAGEAANSDRETPSTAAGNPQNKGDVMTVRGRAAGQLQIGSQQMTETDIAKQPTGNGNITELLRTNPNVQFSETSRNSTTPGELAPEVVSFHGEKFYNNNFIVDGLSNNDRLNPGDNVADIEKAPNGNAGADFPAGHPEAFWVDTSLLESVSVYDSNISAKYGQFTGGVVDATLKRPSFTEASGNISYRTTRSSWAKYHIEDKKQVSFNKATTLDAQPKFTKDFYSITVNQPLNDRAGFTFSYNRKESAIPYWHSYMQKWEDQSRLSETYLLRGSWDSDDNNKFNLTLMYSPHSSTFVRANTMNGQYTNEGGGYSLNFDWANQNKLGSLNTKLAYRQNENSITNQEQNYFAWMASPHFDWRSSASLSGFGGYGRVETEQKSHILQQEMAFNSFYTGAVNHKIDVGYTAEFSTATYNRPTTSYGFTGQIAAPNVVCNGDIGCVDGDQYFYTRSVYAAGRTEVNASTYGVYLQDTAKFSRLTMMPGVRVDYDDYMKNLNVSPRFNLTYNVWNDHHTELFAGANRYYAGNILAYKLRESRQAVYTECRAGHLSSTGTCAKGKTPLATPGPWVYSKAQSTTDYRYSQLNTPYSDELNLGLQQRIGETIWTAKWVHRQGKDQFAAEKVEGTKIYVMTNDGESKADTYSLTVAPVAPIDWHSLVLSWNLGANIQRSYSSNGTYDDEADPDQLIIYRGSVIRQIEKPADNFNRPWSAFAELNTEIPAWRLDWTQRLSYIAGYRSITSKETVSCNVDVRCQGYSGTMDVYEEEQFSPNINLDWRISYTQPLSKQNIKVGLDIFNVLNHVNKTESNYQMGRQYWLDVAYSW
ncbi:putative exported iron receptor protein [Yersinia enterocolitica]|uniref:secretin and TonB N-terminal domain-containing protein n=1 Tax=Yersinia mollaretii TaxID=33060 RepID=UPI0005E83302|nr:secretin and TonB N-terminal domain-containing protein [Yersinia mollaretii]CNK99035.1 putative exported iron receptor protein [Yersinia enterocolitica]